MIIFDDFYREEVRRCYKEIEALEIENKSLRERISYFYSDSGNGGEECSFLMISMKKKQ